MNLTFFYWTLDIVSSCDKNVCQLERETIVFMHLTLGFLWMWLKKKEYGLISNFESLFWKIVSSCLILLTKQRKKTHLFHYVFIRDKETEVKSWSFFSGQRYMAVSIAYMFAYVSLGRNMDIIRQLSGMTS